MTYVHVRSNASDDSWRRVDDGDRAAREGRIMREFNLSPLDLSVLRRLAAGEEIKEIAAREGRSVGTIKLHLRLIRSTLHGRSLSNIVALAIKYGIISADDVP